MKLGKLVKTLKKECPECEAKTLQLRLRNHSNKIKGIEVGDEKEYEYCPACAYESTEKKNKKSKNNKEEEREIW